MPSNKSLVKASNGFPAQNYNPTTGQYEESHGSDNAIHTKVQNFPATQNVQLTGSNVKFKDTNANSTTVITPGGFEIVMINPTTGYFAELRSIYYVINPPNGATTGSHKVSFYQKDRYSFKYGELSAPYNSAIAFRGNDLTNGTPVFHSTEEAFFETLYKMKFDANVPLQIEYTNNTDVDQTNARNISILTFERGAI